MLKIILPKLTFTIIIFLSCLGVKAQTYNSIFNDKYDTVYLDNKILSIIRKDTIHGNAKFICFYENRVNKLKYSKHINNFIDLNYIKVKRVHRIKAFLGINDLIVRGDIIYFGEKKLGYTKYSRRRQICEVTVTKSGLSSMEFQKLEIDLHKYYRKLSHGYTYIFINTNFSEEIAEAKREKERLDKIQNERFYDYVFMALKNPLFDIEGVYKSIDQGETFNYDIVILKSNYNSKFYYAYILKSSDPELKVGNQLFILTKSAEQDKFIMEYSLKSGQNKGNNLAVFSGGIISAGIKSFIKMYPSKVEERAYNEIDTLINWDASGSGVILNTKGYIATNNHVIKDAKKITVKLRNNKNEDVEFTAILISQNENDDVAIIKIEDSNYKPENFNIKRIALSSETPFGQEVFTLGFPDPTKLGENVKLNKGIISAQEALKSKCYFQTDLPVWYGNSGGPCFNSKGELIGLVKGIMMDNKQKIENICYVVNSTCLYRLFNDELRQYNTLDQKNTSKTEVKFTDIVNTVLSNSAFIKVVY